jgi:putative aldouronate transport system permease protein
MVVAYLFLSLALLAVFVPLMFIVSASISSVEAIAAGKVFLWPVGFSLKGYKTILSSPNILTGFYNSVRYAVIGTSVNIVMTLLAAYPLSRKDLGCRRFIMFMFTFTMIFHGGMIPTYLVVSSLGLLDTIWAMIIPGAMGIWNVIMTKTYIETNIPHELYESATLDGCGDFTYLIRIVIPLARPILAVMVLFYAVGHWNSFFNALLYIKSAKLQPLQIVLRDILIVESTPQVTEDLASQMEKLYIRDLLQYALIIVASLPVMILYPFIQKHFIKGIMVGSLKG